MLQLMCFMIYLLRPNFNNFIFIIGTLSARSPQLFQNVDEACQIFLKHTQVYILGDCWPIWYRTYSRITPLAAYRVS